MCLIILVSHKRDSKIATGLPLQEAISMHIVIVSIFLHILVIERGIPLETDISPVYSKLFFELQLVFAQKIADVSQQPLDLALLRYTAFYRILGLDWSFDPTNAVWQAYTQGLQQAAERVDFTYQFYLERYPTIAKFTDEEHWGCFAYDYNPEIQAIHFHFSNQDTSIYGPLSHHRIDVRKSELRAMFQQIKQRHPDAALVQGGSWLYNWEAYRRLFPQAFGQSARKEKMFTLSGRNVWGQFLRRDGGIHQETLSLFLGRVSQLKRIEDYPQCFPYPNVRTQAPIHLFYEF
jgi:hypothetical protein